MARDGTKTGGRNILPGQVLNPRGAGAHNPEVKLIRRLTQDQIEEIGSLILEGRIGDLERMSLDKNTTGLKAMMASVIVKAWRKGDSTAMEAILSRVAGKLKERHEHTGKDGSPLIPPTEEARAAKLTELLATIAMLDATKG